MTKPDDIPTWAWDRALEPSKLIFDAAIDLYEAEIESVSLRAIIARAISEAVAAEREAIITFCENQAPTVVGKAFAAAIRKRGEG